MKIETHVKAKNITIEMPEGVAARYAFALEGKYSSGMYKVRKDQAIEMAIDFFVHILGNASDVAVAAALANLRHQLMTEGTMPENVDMAVSVDGKVLPLDEMSAEIEADIKKDR